MRAACRAFLWLMKPCRACGRGYYHLVHWGLTEDVVAHDYEVVR